MTTDITELAQSLKSAAEKASGSVWTSDGCGGVCSESGTNNGFYVAECDGADWEENSRFIVLANPANILALVEALEKAQQERDEFRNRLKLERSILEDADKRIAELESRTVKLPALCVGVVQGGHAVMVPYPAGHWFNKTAILEMLA
ncbi:TPA: ead/Ea22-like family protein, partial [Klebsiella pneumoniae]